MARPADYDNLHPVVLTEEGEQWLLAEDAALKKLMEGMLVNDARSSERPVRVWFGFPDMEITEQTYPFVTIDLIDIREATERAHQGVVTYVSDLDGNPLPAGRGRRGDLPIPYDLDYQVTVHSRNPRHDRQVVRQMFKYRAPARTGILEVHSDGTKRRLEMLGMATRDQVDENAKRVFIKAFTIRVSSELGTGFSTGVTPFVAEVNTTVEPD